MYESRYEKFGVLGADGRARLVEFRKAGVLASGDQPEVYFFDVDGQQIVVGVSGRALAQWQSNRRYLTREEKIDVAGLWLRKWMEAGGALVAEELYLREPELDAMAGDLGLAK